MKTSEEIIETTLHGKPHKRLKPGLLREGRNLERSKERNLDGRRWVEWGIYRGGNATSEPFQERQIWAVGLVLQPWWWRDHQERERERELSNVKLISLSVTKGKHTGNKLLLLNNYRWFLVSFSVIQIDTAIKTSKISQPPWLQN